MSTEKHGHRFKTDREFYRLKCTIPLLYRHGNVKVENRKALRKLLPYISVILQIAEQCS